jgi:hypothetical protein
MYEEISEYLVIYEEAVSNDFANAPKQIFYHMSTSVQHVLKLQVYSCMHAYLE